MCAAKRDSPAEESRKSLRRLPGPELPREEHDGVSAEKRESAAERGVAVATKDQPRSRKTTAGFSGKNAPAVVVPRVIA